MRRRRTQTKTEGKIIYLFDEFKYEKEARNLSPRTIQSYEQSTRLFLEASDMDRETMVQDISLRDIQDWIRYLKENNVRDTTINHYLRDIRTFLYWCMDNGYIDRPYTISLLRVQEQEPKHFTDEEVARLLKRPKNTESFATWRTWAIVNWILATGNRASTVCAVQTEDINWHDREITIRHTKNRKAQVIPLSKALFNALRDYRRVWGLEDTNYLFPSINGEELTPDALRQAFSKYCKARKVHRTSIHSLRHTFARYWVKNNGNMFVLQKLLGHSSLEMTRRYVNLFSDDIKEDFDEFVPLDRLKQNREHMFKKK